MITGYDVLSMYINARFRDLFFRALDVYDEFEGFISEISVDLDALLASYTECYRQIPVEMTAEASQDLNRINQCFSD